MASMDMSICQVDLRTSLRASRFLFGQPTSNGSWARFIDLANGQGNNNLIFERNNTTNNLDYDIWSGGSDGGSVIATNGIINNSWHLYTVTQNSAGNVVEYRDGVSIQTGTIPLPTNISV